MSALLPLPKERSDYARGQFFGIIAADRGEMDRAAETKSDVADASQVVLKKDRVVVYVPLREKNQKKMKKDE